MCIDTYFLYVTSLQVWALRLMNALVGSSESVREKVYLQEELTLAGLHPPALRKV